MSDDLERLTRLLDDLAAEREPEDRRSLSGDEIELLQTAAFLKAASPERSTPDEQFIERLGARLAALQAPAEPASPAATAANGDTAQRPAKVAPTGISRRGLIGRIAAAAAGVAVGAGAGEALRGRADDAAAAAAYDRGTREGYHKAVSEPFSVPLAPDDRGHWFDTGQSASAVLPGTAVRFRAGAVEGFLVNPGNGKPIYAVSAACTHMGCMVSWLDTAGTFLCPCHGAQYQADGTVLSGIARQPLPRLRVRVDEEGMLEVWGVGEQPPVTKPLPYERP